MVEVVPVALCVLLGVLVSVGKTVPDVWALLIDVEVLRIVSEDRER